MHINCEEIQRKFQVAHWISSTKQLSSLKEKAQLLVEKKKKKDIKVKTEKNAVQQ